MNVIGLLYNNLLFYEKKFPVINFKIEEFISISEFRKARLNLM